jgi:hypothetical protein
VPHTTTDQSTATGGSITTGEQTTAQTQTGSGNTRPRHTWVRAADARTQAIGAPHPGRNGGHYPAPYMGYPNQGTPLTLQASPPIQHYPINPNGPESWDNTTLPGQARLFYNDNNRTTIDVGYHDPRQPTAGRWAEFSNARYRPAAVGPMTLPPAVMPPAAMPPAAANPDSANNSSGSSYKSSSSGGGR